MHDSGVVEHDVHAAPGVESGHSGGDVGFFGDVAGLGGEFLGGGQGGVDGVDFLDSGGEGGGGYVSHEDGGAFAEEEDGCFEADAAVFGGFVRRMEKWGDERKFAFEIREIYTMCKIFEIGLFAKDLIVLLKKSSGQMRNRLYN